MSPRRLLQHIVVGSVVVAFYILVMVPGTSWPITVVFRYINSMKNEKILFFHYYYTKNSEKNQHF